MIGSMSVSSVGRRPQASTFTETRCTFGEGRNGHSSGQEAVRVMCCNARRKIQAEADLPDALEALEELIEAITAPTPTGFYKCRLCGAGPYKARKEIQHAPQCRVAILRGSKEDE